MKKLLIIVFLLAAVIGLYYWANRPSTMLIGKWQGTPSSDVLIFTKDSFSETSPLMPVSGTYKLISNNQMIADYKNTGFGAYSLTVTFRVDAKHLTIIDTNQNYTRIPDNSFDDIIRNIFSGN
jgi:hypothetical protein